jgi:hypothetical protein
LGLFWAKIKEKKTRGLAPLWKGWVNQLGFLLLAFKL